MYLFFDTETTGFLRKLPPGHPDQARCVQLGALLTDDKGNELVRMNRIVKPAGWFIPTNVAMIHGITTEKATAEGIPMAHVLLEFEPMVKQAQLLVGHNFPFDDGIMRNEYGMEAFETHFTNKPFVCTMQEMTPHCRLPKARGDGFKWPKLNEAYFHCFGKSFEGEHTALGDLLATKDIFFWIKNLEEKLSASLDTGA